MTKEEKKTKKIKKPTNSIRKIERKQYVKRGIKGGREKEERI